MLAEEEFRMQQVVQADDDMTKVLLINEEKIPHYRIAVYNYLSEYLKKRNYKFTVVSGGVQDGDGHQVKFDYRAFNLTFLNLARLIISLNPEVIIFWVRLKNLYLFPIILLAKCLRKKNIYWGHGFDLYGKNAHKKKIINNFQYSLSDALILYGEHLKKNVDKAFHQKTFIANNTLYIDDHDNSSFDKESFLAKCNIFTKKNIICVGRMQKRKKLEDLISAFQLLNRKDVGLILVGPDTDGVLENIHGDNIYKLGPVYGAEKLRLLRAADISCLPGAVGLSIVDAFHCGLPLVTEQGDISPEIMYLKDGINGFMVPKGDIQQLAAKIQLLLDDDRMREKYSYEAKKEITTNGHIDVMCRGFLEAIQFVCTGSHAPRRTAL